MKKSFHVLVINPGSTSTKIGLFRDEEEVFTKGLSHSNEDLARFAKMADQYDFRKKIILDALKEHKFDVAKLDCVVGRGGLLRPIPSGVYEVSERMKTDLREAKAGEHASNLGGLIAAAIAEAAGCSSYIVDPVVVDELEEFARLSGHPLLPRISIFHALNQKSVARHAARQLKKRYEDCNLVVAHMGGGVSVGCHLKGRVVDVNNALDGDGPFSPERSGGLPAGQLVKLCFAGKYSEKEIKLMIKGSGGLVAYLGTNDAREVERRCEQGDEKARLIYGGMAYQVSKEIGAMAVVAAGQVDAIVLTGGLAYDASLMEQIKARVSFIGKVLVIPGEKELEALRDGGLRVLRGEEQAKQYA